MKIRLSIVFGFALFGIAGLFAACSPAPETSPPSDPPSQSARSGADIQPTEGNPSSEGAIGDETLVIFLGDSLTAGYELDADQAFPTLIEARLKADGHSVRVVNAGISGDTTAGGLARLDWLLRQEPDILFVGLGGNDGLRGLPLESSEANLRAIIERTQESGARVLLAGMLIPPNYGQDYTEGFAALYPRLAEEFGIARIPFLLEGVAAQPELNLPDGIHPNVEGQRIVAETVYEYLEPLLEEAKQGI